MSASDEAPKVNKFGVVESPEEVLSTLHKDGRRRWIYPKLSTGALFHKRRIVAWALIVLFFALPLIQVGGKPAVFLDIIHRQFTLLGMTFYATDTLLLMLFGLGLMVVIALVTALLGRAWCGWACPQTVYLEFIFRPIERLIEGPENKRRKNDEGPMSPQLAMRKGLKYAIYTLISLAMSHTFVAYFVSWSQLTEWMTSPPTSHWPFFVMMALVTGLILFDFGIFREQMCLIACPYSRFQSVLMDRDSLIVSYDAGRGESRGKRNRAQREREAAGEDIGLGDCIDCGACVRTCPTGIDIRNGLQMECVSCTQCIDACDGIMESLGKPGGLVRYVSERSLEDNEKTKVLRPRVLLYAGLLTLLGGLFAVNVARTGGVEVEITRAFGAPFTRLPNGDVTNRVQLRLRNRTGADADFEIRILEPKEAKLRVVGPPKTHIKQGKMKRVETWVILPLDAFKDGTGSRKARFEVTDGKGTRRELRYTLLGPNDTSAPAKTGATPDKQIK